MSQSISDDVKTPADLEDPRFPGTCEVGEHLCQVFDFLVRRIGLVRCIKEVNQLFIVRQEVYVGEVHSIRDKSSKGKACRFCHKYRSASHSIGFDVDGLHWLDLHVDNENSNSGLLGAALSGGMGP